MKHPYFIILSGVLLLFSVIFIASLVDFIFVPLFVLLNTLTFPIIVAGILFYLINPIYSYMVRKGINKTMAILTIYLSFAAMLAGSVVYLGPLLIQQVRLLVERLPSFAEQIEVWLVEMKSWEFFQSMNVESWLDLNGLYMMLLEHSDAILYYAGENVFSIVGTITGVIVLLVVIPFILFYLLKDGHRLPDYLTTFFPKRHEEEVRRTLFELNYTLTSYIQGMLIVSSFVGVMVFIGYSIIGLDYALLLAGIAMITNVIPFIGPFIGLAFALLVALMDSVQMALLVLLVVIIVQQLESNLISPQVMGKKLHIHPLTIILLLVFAGRFAGFLGLLLAVPVYAISKVLFHSIRRLWKLKKDERERKNNPLEL